MRVCTDEAHRISFSKRKSKLKILRFVETNWAVKAVKTVWALATSIIFSAITNEVSSIQSSRNFRFVSLHFHPLEQVAWLMITRVRAFLLNEMMSWNRWTSDSEVNAKSIWSLIWILVWASIIHESKFLHINIWSNDRSHFSKKKF